MSLIGVKIVLPVSKPLWKLSVQTQAKLNFDLLKSSLFLICALIIECLVCRDMKMYQQPTWRLWGEERVEGAIYTVYLKKVRYHRPTPSASSQDSEDEISHLEWETVRVRFVKAGTLARLVEALATDDGELESTYVNVFLATYRAFATTLQVLELLTERYKYLEDNLTESEQHRKTLISALHVWLDSYPEDFKSANETLSPCLSHLLQFTTHYLPHSDLHAKISHRVNKIGLKSGSVENLLYAAIPKNHSCQNFGESQTVVDNGSIVYSTRNYAQLGMENFTFGVKSPPMTTYLPDTYVPDHRSHFVHEFSPEVAGLDLDIAGICLAPGMRTPLHTMQGYRFPNVPEKHFAEQLTRMDMQLFKKLVPHQCLGAVWSRRDKDRQHEAATVLATVNQFNAVSLRVISSILVEPGLKPNERAAIIGTWIDIAQELRILKNFSSLKAIICGLQSNPIYRLQRVWSAVARDKLELFSELARIFSEDNNQWAQRELLMREGTAKFADTAGEHDRHLQKVFQKQNNYCSSISHGTIPYLGTFLTDLTMIDTAIPDTVAEGLINFDKRRKEFEVLAQIKLLQGAANAYNLSIDPLFDRWFDSLLVLDDRQAYSLSCQVQPNADNGKVNKKPPQGHKKNDSITSTSSSGGSQFYYEIANSAPNSRNNSLDRGVSPPGMSAASSSSSLPSLDVSLSSAGSGAFQQKHNTLKQNGTSPQLNSTGPDFYIIKVTYETESRETEGIVLYKSIMLSNSERTPQVIRNAMLKLNLEGDPSKYTLAQVLPDREMVLPQNANVYYAVNTAYNLNFILRPRKEELQPTR
ncbi:ral guanine nucleotide dissociation stimulator-like 1 [Ctenocephalides felis]|uniref:ral guanine nucleotide dissociation stimulator-like 1 n=1 Tax=Ctenocephalides felis TaxID=7515 RepID=UPI000E6E5AA3|nr:ral guanine nucleotide dissociation stimulator-like 1 [Ctenocephalides felis]